MNHGEKIMNEQPSAELLAYMVKLGAFLRMERDLSMATNGEQGFLPVGSGLGVAIRETKDVRGFIDMNLSSAKQMIMMSGGDFDVLLGVFTVLFATALRAGAIIGPLPGKMVEIDPPQGETEQ